MLVTTSTVAGCSWKRSAILSRREAGVLQADLLADDVEGQRREAAVHLAHDAGQHRAVAHAGVEHAHRRRLGMQVGELHADAARHHLLLAAGVDEQQVLLAVVEEAEVARGRALGAGASWRSRRGRPATRSSGISSRGATGASTPWLVRKALTRSSVSGVMRAPSRRRETNLPSLTARRPKVELGHAGAPAELRNAVQQSDGCVGHRPGSLAGVYSGRLGRRFWKESLPIKPLGGQPQTWDQRLMG